MPRRSDEWRGCVVRRSGRSRLYVKVRIDGRWVLRATPYRVGEESKADAMLAAMRDDLLARESQGLPSGRLTVRAWAKRWLEERERAGDVADTVGERSRLDTHILPALGDMTLDEVRPRHVVAMLDRARSAGLAPRTIRNVYSVARSLWRDARIADLTTASPCELRHRQIGRIHDADPTWRDQAQLTLAELSRLLSDEAVTLERRLAWGLCSLAMLRHGEMAGLRWRALDLEAQPLGRLDVVTSYDTGRTKGRKSRRVPVHPALRPLLAAWRLSGWAERYRRAPAADDLVLPSPRDVGRPRTHQGTYKLLQLDLERLGMRPRRVHDLRRTGISLALSAGADESRLRWATHGRPGTVMGGYTTLEWEATCAEVSRIPGLRSGSTVVPLHGAGGVPSTPAGRPRARKSAKSRGPARR